MRRLMTLRDAQISTAHRLRQGIHLPSLSITGPVRIGLGESESASLGTIPPPTCHHPPRSSGRKETGSAPLA